MRVTLMIWLVIEKVHRYVTDNVCVILTVYVYVMMCMYIVCILCMHEGRGQRELVGVKTKYDIMYC